MPERSIKTARYHPVVLSILERLGQRYRGPASQHLTEHRYRTYYQQGRINASDLAAAFGQYPKLQAGQTLCSVEGRDIGRADIYQAALLYDIGEPNDQQMAWLLAEGHAPQTAMPSTQCRQNPPETEAASELWAHLSDRLDLTAAKPPQQVANSPLHTALRQFARAELGQMLAQLDGTLSLREWIRALSGVDILEQVNQQLQRLCSVFSNPQETAWSTQAHQELDLYGLWRALARQDAGLFLHQLPDWQNIIAELPDHAVATIALQLQRFDLAPASWENYLGKLLEELPDWHGLCHHRPETEILAGLLAVRLTLDRLWLNQICHDHWKIDAHIGSLRHYFEKNLSEFWVRRQLNQGLLPEHLTQQAQELLIRSGSERQCRSDWQHLADLILLQTAMPHQNKACWRLFRLCRHLGLDAAALQVPDQENVLKLQAILADFDRGIRGRIWRAAFEHHYRQALLMELAMAQNSTPPPSSIRIIYEEELAEACQSPSARFGKHRPNSILWPYCSVFLLAPVLLAEILLKSSSFERPVKKPLQLLATAFGRRVRPQPNAFFDLPKQPPAPPDSAANYIICIAAESNPSLGLSNSALQQLAAATDAIPLVAHYRPDEHTLIWEGLNQAVSPHHAQNKK